MSVRTASLSLSDAETDKRGVGVTVDCEDWFNLA